MANNILDNAAEAKKYLEEVMGIVEDEEFNKDRRKKLLALKRKYGRESREKKQNTSISNRKTDCDDIANDASCWVKLIFVSCLSLFAMTSLVVYSDYSNEDVLYIRRIIKEDLLKIGFLFSTPGFNPSSWSLIDSLSWAILNLKSITENILSICCAFIEELLTKSGQDLSLNNQDKSTSTKHEPDHIESKSRYDKKFEDFDQHKTEREHNSYKRDEKKTSNEFGSFARSDI